MDFVARSILGAYLIHEHPGMRILIWRKWLPFGGVYGSSHFVLAGMVVPVAILLGCVAVDMARRALFRAASRSVRGERGQLVPTAPVAGGQAGAGLRRARRPREEALARLPQPYHARGGSLDVVGALAHDPGVSCAVDSPG